MILKLDYINMYLSTKDLLNIENIEKISYESIEHIGKMYREEYFSHFKKKIFLKWFSINLENTDKFLKRSNKLIKKLKIELSEYEKEIVSNIEPREFTLRRSKKTIEAPYSNLDDAVSLEKNVIFLYRDLRVYMKNNFLFELFYKGGIYLSIKEVVLYDKKSNKIDSIVPYKEIEKVTLKKFAVELTLKDKKNIYFRYKDNELIYISFKRSISSKNNIIFLKEDKPST